MFIGCLPLTSLFRSSLTCFYNETCLDQVKMAMMINSGSSNLSIPILDANVSSRFKPDTPLETIVNALMVETWDSAVDYAAYFQQCKVTACSYELSEHNNALVVLLRVLGLCKSNNLSRITSNQFILYRTYRWWNNCCTWNSSSLASDHW